MDYKEKFLQDETDWIRAKATDSQIRDILRQRNEMLDLIKLMNDFQLLVRPSLAGNWICGMWKGVSGDGQAYCWKETEREATTIMDAILQSVEATKYFIASENEKGLYFSNIPFSQQKPIDDSGEDERPDDWAWKAEE